MSCSKNQSPPIKADYALAAVLNSRLAWFLLTSVARVKRGGYIESSIPVYWEDTLDATTKAFKPAADIAKLYRDKGVTAKDDVLVYCQVGMRASHDLFTLALIGHDLTKLSNYYGAWEEWGNRDDTPIKQK